MKTGMISWSINSTDEIIAAAIKGFAATIAVLVVVALIVVATIYTGGLVGGSTFFSLTVAGVSIGAIATQFIFACAGAAIAISGFFFAQSVGEYVYLKTLENVRQQSGQARDFKGSNTNAKNYSNSKQIMAIIG